jgi:hypothetical protein
MKRGLPRLSIFLYRGIGGVSPSSGYKRWPPITTNVDAMAVVNADIWPKSQIGVCSVAEYRSEPEIRPKGVGNVIVRGGGGKYSQALLDARRPGANHFSSRDDRFTALRRWTTRRRLPRYAARYSRTLTAALVLALPKEKAHTSRGHGASPAPAAAL